MKFARLLLVLTLYLLSAVASFAATGGVLVQSAKSHNTVSSILGTFPGAVMGGDLYVACYQWQSNTITRSSVTDQSGNTYTFVTLSSNTTNAYQEECAYTTSSAYRASLTITVTFSAAVTSDLIVSDFSGTGALDPNGAATCTTFTAGTTSPTCSATTSNANDLVIQFFAGANSADTFTPSASFTNIQTQNGLNLGYKTVSAAGTQAASVTSNNSDNFSVGVLTFQQTTASAWARQIQVKNGSAVTSQTCPAPANVAAGSLLVATVQWNQNSAVSMTVSDGLNGAWTAVTSAAIQTTTPGSEQLFYFPNSAAGAVTVTFTTSPATSSTIFCSFVEYVGMATSSPIDGTPVTNALNTAATTMIVPSAGSMATSNANDLIVGACSPSAALSITADTGYTTRMTSQAALEDQFTTATGNFTITCKSGSSNWMGTLAAFKQAGGTRKIRHQVTSY